MPQMAPMLWLILMIFFICILLLFITMNFYSFSIKSNKSLIDNKINNPQFNWKW